MLRPPESSEKDIIPDRAGSFAPFDNELFAGSEVLCDAGDEMQLLTLCEQHP